LPLYNALDMGNTGKIALAVVTGLIGSSLCVVLYNWHVIPDVIPALLFFVSWGLAILVYKSLP
jgi:CHASE2 domain-containing sensor protein